MHWPNPVLCVLPARGAVILTDFDNKDIKNICPTTNILMPPANSEVLSHFHYLKSSLWTSWPYDRPIINRNSWEFFIYW